MIEIIFEQSAIWDICNFKNYILMWSLLSYVSLHYEHCCNKKNERAEKTPWKQFL